MYESIQPLSDVLGVEVIGCQLHENMYAEEVAMLEKLIYDHKVVVFRDQNLTAEQQIKVCKQFGPIEPHPLKSNTCPYPEMSIISNVNENGEAVGYPGPQFLLWHSDMCYEAKPPKFTFLFAERVPEVGGKTIFANSQLAYQELDPHLKRLLQGKKAVFGFSQKLMQRCKGREYDLVIAEEDQRPDVEHDVFKSHPATGVPSIFVNWAHTDSIVGVEPKHSDQLLKQLYEHSEQQKYLYAHQYRQNDLVVWDNSATLHTGDGSNTMKTPRVMRRVVVQYD